MALTYQLIFHQKNKPGQSGGKNSFALTRELLWQVIAKMVECNSRVENG